MSDFRAHYAGFYNAPPATPAGEPIAMWYRATNKRAAIKNARRIARTLGTRVQVFRVTYGSRDPWDAPTFKHCGDLIGEY